MDPDDYVKSLVETVENLSVAGVRSAADRLAAAWARGSTVFVAGNGGSAATASHMACDLAKTAVRGRPGGLRVVPLLDVSAVTAWANDVSYAAVFAGPLAAQARPGDVLIVVSASGNSPNIVEALACARAGSVETIALLGFDGGAARALADHVILANASHYGVVEDVHLAVNHMLTELLRDRADIDVPDVASPAAGLPAATAPAAARSLREV
ncbi:SIS domain-containing protein [Streptomyces sp. MB09-02B]|uniref:D-sedoheptulose-7-phosphate isomerase n=1 Tax=Streptomyces sp. MB09-02B TaxID=3028667 RepID=UPI0029BADDA4|nr:SIS domain-containing protein [Streptomyces sp. MB09-02B]MDX3639996.1 SIS domain-containing protein [Streptomyces sp. MB09-02B]